MSSLKFMWKYIKRHMWQFVFGILSLFVVDYALLFIPSLTASVTDGLTAHAITMDDVWYYIGCILAVGAIITAGRFFWRFFFFGGSRSIEKELRDDMFEHLEKMDVEYYNENKTGDLMSKFTSDLNSVRMALGPAVISSFDASAMAVMVICQMLFYVDVKLTLLAMIPMILIAIGELYYGKLIRVRFKERQEAISSLTDYTQESFSGVRVIKSFVRERAELRAFAKENANAQDKNLRVVKVQAVVIPLLDVVIGISSLITLMYGGYLALTGVITLGKFIAFNQYIGMLVWPMLACGEAITMFSQGGASIRRIQDIFDAKPRVNDEGETVDVDELQGQLTFNHLTYTHKNVTDATLKDICLQVEAGTTLAVIGRTGSGKTTLVNLLLRLYNTEPNMILLDGYDIGKIPLKTLRENIAYVPQDNFLFSDTLRANIAFGAEDDIEKVQAAAKAACVHDNIIDFPEGYETIVGERGVTLSGGQKQRSSIARALMKDAPILILDDALSAVDTDTEERILANLKKNRIGKTTILIAHRISTIQNADVIMVLDDGSAVEIGNHRELIELDGIYRDMFEKQQLEAEVGEQRATLEAEMQE